MNTESHPLPVDPQNQTASHFVHTFMRFYWTVRRRQSVVIACLGVSLLLGLLFFATATRVYQAASSLLVLKTGTESWSPTMSADRTVQDQMATYERLCTSAVVLEDALERLPALPPEVDRRKPKSRQLDELRELLSTNTVRRTSIIELTCRSRDPQAGVNVLNSVVEAYLDFIEVNHRNVATEIVEVLDKERVELEGRIDAQQKKLLAVKHQSGDIGIKEDTRGVHPLVQRVLTLNQTLMEAQQRRIQLEASLAALRRTVKSGGDLRQHLLGLEPLVGKDLILSALGLNTHDAALIASAERQMVKDQAELSALQQHYGPRYPSVVEVSQRIHNGQQYLGSIQQKLHDRLVGISDPELGAMLVNIVEKDLAQTWENERDLQQQYTHAETQAVALNNRLATVTIEERDLELLRNLHVALVNRIENTDINQNQADVRVSVINEPVVPTRPVFPLLPRVLLVCLMLGTAAGLVTVYVLDVLDDRFRSPEELQEQLNVSVLAMIRKHEVREGVGIEAVQVHVAPDAMESEAFRTLRTSLAFSRQEVDRLAVTSSEPGDGKTTVLVNLGVAYAQAGKRTLLIDGDLRRPGLTNLFAMRSEGGLSDILRSDESVASMCLERIRNSGIDGLDILPCGPRPSDPAELLGRERLSDLLGWAETIYDQILVDSAPVLAASDAAILGRMIDGVIVVVQPQKNHRRRVLRAVEGLSALGVNLTGVVVNAISGEESRGYYGYADYGYGYGYGAGYGSSDNVKSVDADIERTDGPAEQYVEHSQPDEKIHLRRRAA